jgi:hypothetical protein
MKSFCMPCDAERAQFSLLSAYRGPEVDQLGTAHAKLPGQCCSFCLWLDMAVYGGVGTRK